MSYRSGNAWSHLKNEEIPSLETFLGSASGKPDDDVKSFDDNTDKLLEEQALKNLAERQKASGK